MKIRNFLLGTVIALGFSSVANAGLITIDDFSTDQGPVTVQSPGPGGENTSGWVQSGFAGDASIIGGFRDIRVRTFDPAPGTSSSEATVLVRDDEFSFSSGSGVIAQFDLRWDGANDTDTIDADGLGGINLLFDSGTNFLTPIISADANGWFSATFWSDQGNNGTFLSETRKLYIPGHEQINSMTNSLNEPRQSFFSNDIFEFTNFESIGAISVSGNILVPTLDDPELRIATRDVVVRNNNDDPIFAGSRLRDYDLRLAGTSAVDVPEPSMAGLLGLGLAGMAFAGVRRRKATVVES